MIRLEWQKAGREFSFSVFHSFLSFCTVTTKGEHRVRVLFFRRGYAERTGA